MNSYALAQQNLTVCPTSIYSFTAESYTGRQCSFEFVKPPLVTSGLNETHLAHVCHGIHLPTLWSATVILVKAILCVSTGGCSTLTNSTAAVVHEPWNHQNAVGEKQTIARLHSLIFGQLIWGKYDFIDMYKYLCIACDSFNQFSINPSQHIQYVRDLFCDI